MKRLTICLALAVLLALAAAPPAMAMKLVEQGGSQDTTSQKESTKKKAPPSAGTIRTEDGKVYTVPKSTGGSGQEKSGDGKQ